ncbi:DUF4145 domain-containing protein [Patescibacteria group bacterium]|nr:DUF4145 domain-containing protein [Patescibacteria group bacterium]
MGIKKEKPIDNARGNIKTIACVKCLHETDHEVRCNLEIFFQDGGDDCGEDYAILECRGCHDITFVKTFWLYDEFEHDDKGNITGYALQEELFPNRVTGRKKLECHAWASDSLPKEIGPIYEETYQALCNKQAILCAAGLRILLERVCNDVKIDGRNLEEKINCLQKNGFCSAKDARLLHGARLFGNEVIHEISPNDAELESAFDVLEHLLHSTYILPKKTKSLQERAEKNPVNKRKNSAAIVSELTSDK